MWWTRTCRPADDRESLAVCRDHICPDVSLLGRLLWARVAEPGAPPRALRVVVGGMRNGQAAPCPRFVQLVVELVQQRAARIITL